ncbi:transmembrane protein, putative [Medicago truncatula]|uniref:Transmembrane protein, putative n=1 Tax=Medicago truncatula TaxID=3880 RepID=G7IQV1_MEDTR|nr:transmembrane protein, putative [Medicago truncatula]
MRLGQGIFVVGILNVEGAGVILCVFAGLARAFSPYQLETFTINTSLPHSELLVQNCDSTSGRQLWNFGRVSIFSLIF